MRLHDLPLTLKHFFCLWLAIAISALSNLYDTCLVCVAVELLQKNRVAFHTACLTQL